MLLLAALVWPISAHAQAAKAAPTFYRGVLPILQQHCQTCHRTGEIAPMPLVTYKQAKHWAPIISKKTTAREMPP